MYANYLLRTFAIPRSAPGSLFVKALFCLGFSWLLLATCSYASAQPEVIRNITQSTERLEMMVNSSRILTLEKRIPRMVVNNPELVSATPISANQIQLAARKPGITQINLWDEDDQIYTVDVLIHGDVRELQHALKQLFPESSVKVVRLINTLVLEGFVERPEAISPILRLAEDYAPKVVNNITVGGVQQVLLKVKVMEVSRTKLRTLGVDWGHVASGGSIVASGITGLITSATTSGGVGSVTSGGTAAGETFKFGVVDGNNALFAFLEALQQNSLAKVLADPTLTAVSGRPAHFNVGGELPIIIPSGLGQTTVEYKKFGTQVDFLPIVLGNGNIRLEVRPRVSEIDDTRSVTVGSFSVPALKVREVDTGVELKAGQTLALAGLVQTRIEAQERGLPFVSSLPYIGTAFRKVTEEVNEIELLILVTPELVDGMDPHEVPKCGPGMESVSPSNCQLYLGGHLEVPTADPCGSGGCGVGCQFCQGTYSAGGQTAAATYPISTDYGAHSVEMLPIESGIQQGAPVEVIQPGVRGSVQFKQPKLQKQPSEPAGNSGYPGQSLGADPTASWQAGATATPGLIGPIGYDVE
ncbi:MAG: pilus assembly protein N-terminal domain-containing protein [Pirellulales bacterium]|nr:pilus assembly protein N-terminal domain-containing protein [Pirellulales bacterium]